MNILAVDDVNLGAPRLLGGISRLARVLELNASRVTRFEFL